MTAPFTEAVPKAVITLRPAEGHEARWECNGCHFPSTYAVLVVGTKFGKRSEITSSFRMCMTCLRLLRSHVIQQTTPGPDGDIVFRSEL